MPDSVPSLSAALSDRYRIERELGRGGTATVYLAEDVKHRRHVAIKVLDPELAAAIGAERFLREIETTASLRHPHILPLYDSGQVETGESALLYYVMPWIEGESLRDRLNRESQLPLDDAIGIARDVADALSYAHGRGILHRDIKPENILLESGHAVVADFGIAKALTSAGGHSLTETGVSVGTPRYMSPEQLTDGTIDGRSDIYALGCVVYEMLAGEPPHGGPSAQAVFAKRLAEPPPRLRTLRETVPGHVEDAVQRALARVPADRYATAAEFRTALGPAVTGPRWVERPSGPLRLLTLYGLASLGLLAAIRALADTWALPAWFVPGAAVLLLIGLPIIVTSMLVQRGSLRLPAGLARMFALRRTLLGGVFALAAWGVAVTAYMLLGNRSVANGPDDATTIAVLPFEVTGLDTTLWKWGAATLVSANLDGVGTLRRIDSRTLESRWRRQSGGRDRAVETARALGAKYVLTASMVNAAGSVRISADLYDADSGTQLAPSVQVAGSADSVPALLDRLSIEVLRHTPLVAGVVGLPEIDIARVTSASPDAVKAYLAGDELYRRSRWQLAIDQFNHATELDSTFALAWYRLALAHGWMLNPAERLEYARRAARFSSRLPERERQLVRGLEEMASGNPASIVTFEDYTRRYPDDVEGWTLLGDAAYALGGLRLDPLDRFRSAHERALQLSPWFGPAYLSLLNDGFARADSARLHELLAGYRRIDAKADYCIGIELAFALAFGDSAQKRWAIGSLDTLGAAPTQPVWCTAVNLLTRPDYEEPLQIVLQSMERPQRPPDARAQGELMRIGDLINGGRIREARQRLDSRLQQRSSLYALSIPVMLQVTHYGDSAAMRRTERTIADSPHRQAPFWAGVLAASAGRHAAVRDAAQQLRERADARASIGDTLGASGNLASARALELYDELRLSPGEANVRALIELLPGLGWSDDIIAARLLRFEVGRALLELGHPAEAQRVFTGFNAFELGGDYGSIVEYYLGRTAEALGSPDARSRYQRFIEWWEDADPELQPWRTDARNRLARLVAEPVQTGR